MVGCAHAPGDMSALNCAGVGSQGSKHLTDLSERTGNMPKGCRGVEPSSARIPTLQKRGNAEPPSLSPLMRSEPGGDLRFLREHRHAFRSVALSGSGGQMWLSGLICSVPSNIIRCLETCCINDLRRISGSALSTSGNAQSFQELRLRGRRGGKGCGR